MPYAIRKRGKSYAIVNRRTGKTVGKSSSKAKAKASARARNAGAHGWHGKLSGVRAPCPERKPARLEDRRMPHRAASRECQTECQRPARPVRAGQFDRESGSGGRTRTYDQAVNSRPLYH
jgi:hypothetical protein